MACISALRSTTATTADTLASGTEEALHTVQIGHILTGRLLRLALAVVDFLMIGLLLQVSTVVAKSSLSLTTRSIGLK